jgi:hypothetical protein
LEQRVLRPMGLSWKDISDAASFVSQIAQLVTIAQQSGRIEELLRLAREANPGNDLLRKFNETAGRSPKASDLVEAVRPALRIDDKEWTRRLVEVEQQICMITSNLADGTLTGTGFLVGPDQVMTHASVLGNDTTKALEAGAITVSFDRVSISSSTYVVLPQSIFMSDDATVLRLDRPAGRDTVADPAAATSGRARGWLTPRDKEGTEGAVVIPHYDDRGELKVSADPGGLTLRSDGRIQYRAFGGAGSTGAPCFDASWRLIGINIGSELSTGDPGTWIGIGIGIAPIVSGLREHNLAWDVTSGVYSLGAPIETPKSQGDLDDLVRSFEIQEAGHDPEDEVWIDDPDGNPSDVDRWAWAEAAAVTAYFDSEQLRPAGTPSADARVAVLLESSPVRGASNSTRWMLSERARVRALERLAKRGTLLAVRDANVSDPSEILDVVLGGFISGAQPTGSDLQNPDRLRAMLQVAGWLSRTDLALPPVTDLRAALERATLLAPFRHLTRGFFAGRDSELATLAAYVDGPDADRHGQAPAPILIHGPGGMGKSALLAHFILANSERDATKPDLWRPFVYLDFDRPELDARDLSGVLLAIARQV